MDKQPQALLQSFLIIDILQRIPRSRFTTSTHLHEQLQAAGYDISMRTLQRWLEAISQHYPIECDMRCKPFGYRWMEGAQGFNLPVLSPPEALLLELARSEVAQMLPTRVIKTLAPLFDSARRQLDGQKNTAQEQRWLKKVKRIPESLPLKAPRTTVSVFETISDALYHETTLHLHYRNVQNQLREAVVQPLGVVQQANRLYLVCRFEGFSNERVLALPRISQAKLGVSFQYPQDFNLNDYVEAGHFGILRGDLIKLSFFIHKIEGQHLVESPLSNDQKIIEEPDGFRITATLPDTELLRRWLRSWGDAVSDIQITPIKSA